MSSLVHLGIAALSAIRRAQTDSSLFHLERVNVEALREGDSTGGEPASALFE